jgi:hypothetical protein
VCFEVRAQLFIADESRRRRSPDFSLAADASRWLLPERRAGRPRKITTQSP